MNKQIDEMAKALCGLDRECEHCTASMSYICKAKKYAERAYNTGYRKQSEGEWISVEDRMPTEQEWEENRGLFMVYESYQKAICLSYLCRNEWTDDHSLKPFHKVHKVTHWMPLPEPPKGDEGK